MLALAQTVPVTRAKLYRVDDVAEMLDVTPDTVRRWIANGQLRGVRVGGQWRVPASAVDKFLDPDPIADSFTAPADADSDVDPL